MPFMRTGGIALFASLMLSACMPNMMNGGIVSPWMPYPVYPPAASAPAPQPTPASYVDVYKYQGARQCENNGIPLNVMRRELDNARIPIINSSCGRDGRLYPSYCGGADGKINIYTIPSNAVNAARSYGFIPVSTLSGAQRTTCMSNSPPSPPRPVSRGTYVPRATTPYPSTGGTGDSSYYSYR